MTGTLKQVENVRRVSRTPALPNASELSESLSHLMCRYGLIRAALHQSGEAEARAQRAGILTFPT